MISVEWLIPLDTTKIWESFYTGFEEDVELYSKCNLVCINLKMSFSTLTNLEKTT